MKITDFKIKQTDDLKIFVTGVTGSGKTYLAKKISSELNIPYFDFDNMWDYKKDNFIKESEYEFLNKLPKTFALDAIPFSNNFISFREYCKNNNTLIICLIHSDIYKWIKNIVNKPYYIQSSIYFKQDILYHDWVQHYNVAENNFYDLNVIFYDVSEKKLVNKEDFLNTIKNTTIQIKELQNKTPYILEHYINNLPYTQLRTFQDIECIKYEGFSKSWKTWETIKSFVDWKDKTIVDIGPFHGYFSFKAEQAGAKKVYGLEIDPDILETVNIIKKIIVSNVEFSLWGGTTPTPQADIALILNVFHHVKDKELLLQNIKANTVIFEVKKAQLELVQKYFNIIKEVESHRVDLDTNLHRFVLLGEKK